MPSTRALRADGIAPRGRPATQFCVQPMTDARSSRAPDHHYPHLALLVLIGPSGASDVRALHFAPVSAVVGLLPVPRVWHENCIRHRPVRVLGSSRQALEAGNPRCHATSVQADARAPRCAARLHHCCRAIVLECRKVCADATRARRSQPARHTCAAAPQLRLSTRASSGRVPARCSSSVRRRDRLPPRRLSVAGRSSQSPALRLHRDGPFAPMSWSLCSGSSLRVAADCPRPGTPTSAVLSLGDLVARGPEPAVLLLVLAWADAPPRACRAPREPARRALGAQVHVSQRPGRAAGPLRCRERRFPPSSWRSSTGWSAHPSRRRRLSAAHPSCREAPNRSAARVLVRLYGDTPAIPTSTACPALTRGRRLPGPGYGRLRHPPIPFPSGQQHICIDTSACSAPLTASATPSERFVPAALTYYEPPSARRARRPRRGRRRAPSEALDSSDCSQ